MESYIEEIQLNCIINEIYATSVIKQKFANNSTESIELVVTYPLKKENALTKFTAIIGDKVITSKIYPKEKAEEKYTDSLASGNAAILGKYTPEDNYEVYLGNLAPGEELELNSEFIQLLSSSDKSYEFSFSLAHYPKISGSPGKRPTVNIALPKEPAEFPTVIYTADPNAPHTITLHTKESSEVSRPPVHTKFTGELKTASKITRLISRSHQITRDFSDDFKYAKISLENSPNQKEICIFFRTENMNTLTLYEQYDPVLNNYAYIFQFLLDQRKQLTQKIESPDINDSSCYEKLYEEGEINESPGVYIFLIDQSGSMKGKKIQIAEESIKLFLQSLPANSYYEVIGFGSSCQWYTDIATFYNKANVTKTFSKINFLSACLGGTDISRPLELIFNNRKKYNANLSKNIFLLTDGKVDYPEESINLISDNSSHFRVHTIGIGSDFDYKFIENCAKIGKGSYSFAQDILTLKAKVIYALNSALKPYLNNMLIEVIEDKFQESKIIEYPNQIASNALVFNDEIYRYSFVTSTRLNDTSAISFKAYDPMKNTNVTDEFKVGDIRSPIENGNQLNKAIAGTALKFLKNLDEQIEIDLALQFQVLSAKTSLFAEIPKESSDHTELKQVSYKIQTTTLRPQNVLINRYQPHHTGRILLGANPFVTMCRERAVAPQLKMAKRSMAMPSRPQASATNKVLEKLDAKQDVKRDAKCEVFLGTKGKKLSQGPLISYTSLSYADAIHAQPKASHQQSTTFKEKDKDSAKITILDDEKCYNDLISCQDMFDGSWCECTATKAMITKCKDAFNKVSKYVKATLQLDDLQLLNKIIFTVMVIMFLNNKYADKKAEFLLIVNKAKKYLKTQGLDFEKAAEAAL